MKAIIPDITDNSSKPYYLQLYQYIKKSILTGEISADEKLPSLRLLSKTLQLSITTIDQAYSQLLVEGYIYSKPQSGYYACDILNPLIANAETETVFYPAEQLLEQDPENQYYDLNCFSFSKWKKCMNKVLTEYAPQLFFESDPQGELALRTEIAKYLYLSRGVICQPDQIVIGAGTQQITNQLANILKKMSINLVAVEDPGFMPVNNIFRDRGFAINPVTVGKEGINIEKLPSNIRSAVYVSPSNQVPTGAVMPVGRRYELLEWAIKNDSIIIEDDYDSELRYFGKPIPALQGLDTAERVVYLGSFSATLFSSIKISYMVLPPGMASIFQSIRSDYTQTCSKTEQLTLALFMEAGHYQTNIKKLRNLYAQKLQLITRCLTTEHTRVTNTFSGITVIVHVQSEQTADELCADAAAVGIHAVPVIQPASVSSFNSAARYESTREDVSFNNDSSFVALLLYYNQIPLEEIPEAVKKLLDKWHF